MINLLLPLFTGLIAMFPLDFEMKTEHKNDYYNVDTVCKVTKTGDTYNYFYSIKNNGKSSVKVKWGVLNKALNLGQDVDMMWDIEPGENINFVLEHPDPPQLAGDRVSTHTGSSIKEFEKTKIDLPKGVKIDMPKANFYRVDVSYGQGALPKTFVSVFQRR
jgi:hypothetical protein